MKFATKMMLVPAGRVDPEINYLSELDKQMSEVLKNKRLSSNEKMNLYNQILRKNLAIEARYLFFFIFYLFSKLKIQREKHI